MVSEAGYFLAKVNNVKQTSSCTFAEDRILNDVRENDILKFNNVGAYCFSMASNYNSRLKPAEILILNGKDYLIRKRETLDDLIKNQIDIRIENHCVNSGLM